MRFHCSLTESFPMIAQDTYYRPQLVGSGEFPGLTMVASGKDSLRPLGGSMAITFAPREDRLRCQDGVSYNLAQFMADCGLATNQLVMPYRQVHGSDVAVVTDLLSDVRDHLPDFQLGETWPCLFPTSYNGHVDALVSTEPALALGVRGADCPWALAFDPETNVFGAAHLSWKAVSKGLVQKFVTAMSSLGADPARLRLYLSTGAGVCCYEIRQDLILAYLNEGYSEIRKFLYAHHDATKRYFSQSGLIRMLLNRAGVQEDHIEMDPRCTMCFRVDDEFALHSSRRDRGDDPAFDVAGRNLAVINWRRSI